MRSFEKRVLQLERMFLPKDNSKVRAILIKDGRETILSESSISTEGKPIVVDIIYTENSEFSRKEKVQ